MTADVDQSLVSGFLRSSARYASRPALEADGRVLTYAELHAAASSIADLLLRIEASDDPPLTAVFGGRTPTTYAGILGALLRRHGYVPLNPSFPEERTAAMLNRAGCRAVVVDSSSLESFATIAMRVDHALSIVVPEGELTIDAETFGNLGHRLFGQDDLDDHAVVAAPETDPSSIAYLLFTSGSTGQPKGVMVAHRNVRHFLEYMTDRYEVSADDRFSQTFDLTFDLSVFDMFMAWESGAVLCCPGRKQLIRPDRFISDAGLTVWFSVPSLGIYMNRLGMLKDNAFPSLRLSLFCGEALPVEIADAWSTAAPMSALENLYGPTELTIACTHFRFEPAADRSAWDRGIVPIGYPYPGMEPLVVDEEMRPVPEGLPGELLMTGPQMALGYWRDDERTNAAFVTPPGMGARFYRTGDRVRVQADGGPLFYLGRVDHQIKVRGFRVELGEVEAALRDASGLQGVVAVGWPVALSGADAVEAFVEADDLDGDALASALRRRLPEYMVPRRIHALDRLPLNANGKYDRPALLTMLEAGVYD